MLVPVQVRAPARPSAWPDRRRRHLTPHRAPNAVLELQRTAGNRAVVGLLAPVAVQRQPDHPPIKDVYPAGTLDAAAWTRTHQEAKAALAKGDAATAEAKYLVLLADAATVAGITILPGFSPTQINVVKGKTAGGLNLSLDRGDDPGHVGIVDASGTHVALEFAKKVPAVEVALTISPRAFNDDKSLSLRTIRHEMLHARHRQMTLAAVAAWHKAKRPKPFGEWVGKNAKRLKLSDADVVLVQKGAEGGHINTEVLAYVEGFMTEFHLTKPTKAGTEMAFVELLGAVETTKFFTWKNADQKVRDEALARLKGYWATLGAQHQERWKEWVANGVAKNATNKDGRKEFFAALATFVK
jgi:hypothetical protein